MPRTLRHGSSEGSWNATESPAWRKVSDGGAPAMSIRPEVGVSSPAIMRRSVDFPQPDGPTSAVVRPGSKVRFTSRTASVPPAKIFVTPSQAMRGGGVSGAMNLFENGAIPEIG